MKTIVTLLRTLLFFTLMLLWACNFPHHQVSDYIGSIFPWPSEKSWKWSALLLEGALIQLAIGLPMAFLLSLTFSNLAIRVACALAAVFAVRALFELPSTLSPPFGTALIVYLAACHFLSLLGLTVVVRRRLLRFNPSFKRAPLRAAA